MSEQVVLVKFDFPHDGKHGLSDKEKAMFYFLGVEIYASEEDTYIEAFYRCRNGLLPAGNALESFKRCYEAAFIKCNPYRLTSEFEALIDLGHIIQSIPPTVDKMELAMRLYNEGVIDVRLHTTKLGHPDKPIAITPLKDGVPSIDLLRCNGVIVDNSDELRFGFVAVYPVDLSYGEEALMMSPYP